LAAPFVRLAAPRFGKIAEMLTPAGAALSD
jgi:hypothetical protein